MQHKQGTKGLQGPGSPDAGLHMQDTAIPYGFMLPDASLHATCKFGMAAASCIKVPKAGFPLKENGTWDLPLRPDEMA